MRKWWARFLSRKGTKKDRWYKTLQMAEYFLLWEKTRTHRLTLKSRGRSTQVDWDGRQSWTSQTWRCGRSLLEWHGWVQSKMTPSEEQGGWFEEKSREARQILFGHLQRRDSDCISRRMLRMGQVVRRSRGRPKRRIVDVVKENMKLIGVRKEDAEKRGRWRQPWWPRRK